MMLLSGSVKFACAPSAGRPPVVACVSLRGSAPGRAAAPPPAGLSSGGSSSPARARRFAAFVLSPLRTRASSCFAAVASIPSACPRNARARAVRASSSNRRAFASRSRFSRLSRRLSSSGNSSPRTPSPWRASSAPSAASASASIRLTSLRSRFSSATRRL